MTRDRSLIEFLGGSVNLWNPPTFDGLIAVSGERRAAVSVTLGARGRV